MELLVERIFAIFIAISGPILTIFDLPGNTLLLLTSLMFAFLMRYFILTADCCLLWYSFMLWVSFGSSASAFSASNAVKFLGSLLFSLPWEALPALCSVH